MDDLTLVSTSNIDPDRYRSYLLRLWREAPGASWRCQVQCVGTNRELRFAGLAELFEFLEADTAPNAEETESSNHARGEQYTVPSDPDC